MIKEIEPITPVQGSALMGDFQTQADLVGIFAEDLLVRHNDETGGVAVGIVDPFFQNLQSVGLTRIFAGDGRLGLILVLCHLQCCESVVLHADLLPVMLGDVDQQDHEYYNKSPEIVFKGSCDKNGNQDPYTTDRNDKYFQPILKIQFRFSVQFYNERGKFNNQIPDNFR